MKPKQKKTPARSAKAISRDQFIAILEDISRKLDILIERQNAMFEKPERQLAQPAR